MAIGSGVMSGRTAVCVRCRLCPPLRGWPQRQARAAWSHALDGHPRRHFRLRQRTARPSCRTCLCIKASGCQLRKEAWFRAVADPTGGIPTSLLYLAVYHKPHAVAVAHFAARTALCAGGTHRAVHAYLVCCVSCVRRGVVCAGTMPARQHGRVS